MSYSLKNISKADITDLSRFTQEIRVIAQEIKKRDQEIRELNQSPYCEDRPACQKYLQINERNEGSWRKVATESEQVERPLAKYSGRLLNIL